LAKLTKLRYDCRLGRNVDKNHPIAHSEKMG